MASTVSEGLSRVTIVAPHTRMDLALPSDVPLAELLPTLLRHAGEVPTDDAAERGGWSLRRLGSAAFDLGSTTGELEIRDGELLYLTPRDDAQPEVVFDDVVDAVATSTQRRARKWRRADTRRFGVGLTVLALLGALAALLFTGPPQLASALVSGGLGLALLVTATLVSRLADDPPTGALFGFVGVAYGGVGGLLLLAGDRTVGELAAPHMLLGATFLVVYGAVGALGVGGYPHVFLGGVVVGLMLVIAGGLSLVLGMDPAPAAAVVATLAFGTMPMHPMMGYRLARLPTPTIPTGPDDLKGETASVEGRRVLQLSDRAADYLTGLTCTAAVVVLGGVVVVLMGGAWQGLLFGALLSVLLLLRARPLSGRTQRLAVLLSGAVGLAAVAIAAFAEGGLGVRFALVLGGVLVIAVVSSVYGLLVAGRRISPMWGRMLDIFEILMIVAVVPIAAWVGGLYGWIATIGR